MKIIWHIPKNISVILVALNYTCETASREGYSRVGQQFGIYHLYMARFLWDGASLFSQRAFEVTVYTVISLRMHSFMRTKSDGVRALFICLFQLFCHEFEGKMETILLCDHGLF